MKTVTMVRDHDVQVQAAPRVVRHYRAGETYPDVLEFDVAAIVAAGAGSVVAAAAVTEKPATRRTPARAKHRARRNG